jgi:hypothetical protein
MATLEIKREQPKVKVITMGQQDKEIEYEEYYPPGTTEPILREKQPGNAPSSPRSALGVVSEERAEEPASPEYGDGVRINEQGEKILEFGTLNKKDGSPSAPKAVNNEQREKKKMANDKDLEQAGTKTIREDKPSEQGAIGTHGKNAPAKDKVPAQGEGEEEKK